MTTRKQVLHTVALLLGLMPLVGNAQNSRWYAGIGVGSTSADMATPKLPHLDYTPPFISTGPSGPVPLFSSSFLGSSKNTSATDLELLLGWRVLPQLAVEAAYRNIGSVSATARSNETESHPNTPGSPVFNSERSHTYTWKSQGVSLALSGLLPLSDRFSLLGQLGALYLDQDAYERVQQRYIDSSRADRNQQYPSGDTHLSWFAAVGIEMVLAPRVTARLSYRHMPKAGEQVNGEQYRSFGQQVPNGDIKLQQVGLSLLYTF